MKNNKFVRYGNLDIYNKQEWHVKKPKQNDPISNYHLAPVSRGYYAMPFKYVEMFLVGAVSKTQPEQFKKLDNLYDEKAPTLQFCGNEAVNEKEYEDHFNKINAKRKKIYSKNRKIFILKDEDLVWHHLEEFTPLNEIEKRSGSWILTTVKTYNNSIKKSFKNHRGYMLHNTPEGKIIEYSDNRGYYRSYDMYEIFVSPIEHI